LSSKPRHFVSRRSAVLAMLALAGCGLTPVYGPGGAGAALRGNVVYVTPATKAGFALRNRLKTRLGTQDGAADYQLIVQSVETRDAAAVTSDGDITRFSILGTAKWTVIKGDVTLGSGTVETFTSYAATGSTVATQAAEEDAVARLSVALADLIVADVILAQP